MRSQLLQQLHFYMISFGDCKNSIYVLKTHLKKMGYFELDSCLPLRDFQEDKFRSDNDTNGNRNNNKVMLQILHFILMDYCTHIYKELLEIVPSLKLKNDQEFVESAISIARDYYHISSGVTSQQYLRAGYLNKKLEFMANLTKAVYNKSETIKKSKSKQGAKKDIAKDLPVVQQSSQIQPAEHRWTTNFNNLEDSEEQVPMNITAAPMKIDFNEIKQQTNLSKKLQNNIGIAHKQVPASKKQRNQNIHRQFVVDGQTFDERQIKQALEQRHPTPVHTANNKQKIHMDGNKTINFQPGIENLKEQSKYLKYQLDEEKNKVRTLQQHIQQSRNNIRNKSTKQENSEEVPSECFVRKQDFNQLVSLIKVLSGTVNEISAKFADLEASVSSQINNLNARVLMIQSSVRLLKDNL